MKLEIKDGNQIITFQIKDIDIVKFNARLGEHGPWLFPLTDGGYAVLGEDVIHRSIIQIHPSPK